MIDLTPIYTVKGVTPDERNAYSRFLRLEQLLKETKEESE
tara:strand:+ start:3742 stop:3861 length:120 start_codon:yes stop_codon:yes gene_type:complete